MIVSTENLAGWHNVFSLLLGWQPFSTTNICTKAWSIGNPASLVTSGHSDTKMVHRAVFTFYALKKFVKLWGFTVEREIVAGYYPLPNNFLGNYCAKIDKRHTVYMALVLRKSIIKGASSE
jgi:hypothetical protein